MRRTHHCGVLRLEHVGSRVCLCGWVHSRRDHGGVIFLDLRDRTGLAQVVCDPGKGGPEAHAAADQVRAEYVLRVEGRVVERAPGMANPKIPTGDIEVIAECVEVLNRSEHPPFEIDGEQINPEARLRYRYIDLRRPAMQRNLQIRHDAAQAARKYLCEQGFLEVETPLLLKATPEGARDFVVPCRAIPGTFYVLPQSPQLMKQTLMASGCDRYFQLAKCLRDEDLRADRQYEHTQIDLEMSFVEQDELQETIEGLMRAVFASAGIDLAPSFPKLSYEEAMRRYGSDKPDTRFGVELTDLSDVLADVDFRVFKEALAAGGQVKGICVPAKGQLSRKNIDDLTSFARDFGAKGLAWIVVEEDGLRSSILKFIPEDVQQAMNERMGGQPGDVLLFVADQPKVVAEVLGRLRVKLGHELGLIPDGLHHMLWVTDFPLFEPDAESPTGIQPMHHPFSMPRPDCLQYLDTEPLKVYAQLYDLVYNGAEFGSGSIRIHDPDLQMQVLNLIGIGHSEAYKRFGFLLEVFSHGAPPHGGIGLGFDRIVSVLCGQEASEADIREVIAFPKTSTGRDLMLGCPSPLPQEQLDQLSLLSVAPVAAASSASAQVDWEVVSRTWSLQARSFQGDHRFAERDVAMLCDLVNRFKSRVNALAADSSTDWMTVTAELQRMDEEVTRAADPLCRQLLRSFGPDAD
ncbi:MAG: aspartate--tRNA ligase [Armatimonadetes bacterium]|nr:aspartate--tRNA ligase [Armatimonadota bacterium]